MFLENEKQMSKWNFEVADTDALFDLFAKAEAECQQRARADVPIAAYEQAIEASHVFNLLQARGVISVQERASYMGRVRDLARGSCEAYMAKEADRWASRIPGVVGVSLQISPFRRTKGTRHPRRNRRARTCSASASLACAKWADRMTDFLLELRSEEIPARMQAGARATSRSCSAPRCGAGVAAARSPCGRPRAGWR